MTVGRGGGRSARAGVGAIVHVPAASRMARVDWLTPALAQPAAMQDWALAQEMPLRVLLLFPVRLGLGTTAQPVPFHRSIKVTEFPGEVLLPPTA